MGNNPVKILFFFYYPNSLIFELWTEGASKDSWTH